MGKFHDKYRIFECVAGSYSYGTSVNTDSYHSDEDTRGIFVAEPSYIISCVRSIEQEEDAKQDFVSYELRKFLKLAAQNNPNVLELLYTDKENIKFIDWPFQKIRDNAHLFLSKKARHTFSGYAMAQLHRIKGHRKWINSPAADIPPVLSDYCIFMDTLGSICRVGEEIRKTLEDKFLVQTLGRTTYRVYCDPLGNFNPGCFNSENNDVKYVDIKEEKLIERNPYFVGTLTVRWDDFSKDINDWKGYWNWKKNRNPVRAKLEEKCNYDSKNALHLVRLMRMCKEILTEGKVIVRRPDAEELLEIRNGKWTYDELIKWAEDMDSEMNELYEKSSLPFSANYDRIDDMYREIVFEWWKQKGLVSTYYNYI